MHARSDDGSGRLAAAFHLAARDLGPLAQRARIDPADLAARAARVLAADRHGTWDELIPILAPQLGTAGLALVGAAMQAWRAEPATTPAAHDRRMIGWPGSGPTQADARECHHRQRTTTRVLQQIADSLGDVDGYIAQIDHRARQMPDVAAGIARRLLDAGRPQAAWAALDAVAVAPREQAAPGWEEVRVDVLEALGRGDAAQEFRWQLFCARLDVMQLRAYLLKLADFDDVEAEQRALDHALGFGDAHQALAFLVAWPDLRRANQLVLARSQALNGDLCELLSRAADALHSRYPLAATLLRRIMIDFTLRTARSARYRHAARHLDDCRADAARVEDFGSVPDHPAFERALRAAHGRKVGFWQEVHGEQSS